MPEGCGRASRSFAGEHIKRTAGHHGGLTVMKAGRFTIPCLYAVASLLSFADAPTRGSAPADAIPAKRPKPVHLEFPDDPPMARPPAPPVAGPRGGGPVVRGEFVSIQVNVDAMQMNIPGDAANEPSIALDATDPSKIVIAWRQFDTVASNFRQAGYAYSHDGGETWTFPGVLEPGVFRSDPVLSFDTDGAIYYNSLRVEGNQFDCDVFISEDAGLSWSRPFDALGGDKCWMDIDRTGGIGHGNIYEAWNTAGNMFFPNTFSRSIDGGATWSTPIEVPNRPVFGSVNVGPDGEVYVAGVPNSASTDEFWVVKSTTVQNPLQTPAFQQAVQVNMGGSLEIGGAVNPAGLLGQVWVATDHSTGQSRGNVYVLCSVAPPTIGDPMDVKFIRSTNGGLNWSSPVRINDDQFFNGAWQWFGTMSVAPNGRIDAVWNDTRADFTSTNSELYYSYSIDAGASWRANVPLSPPFNHSLGYPNQDKLGDYYHMISHDSAAHLAYAATFNLEQDVYYLRIAADCNENGVHDGTDVMSGASPDCNANGTPDECEFPGCPGLVLADMNCDDEINGADIAGFVETFVAGGYACQADLDQDGSVTMDDAGLFVMTLLAAS